MLVELVLLEQVLLMIIQVVETTCIMKLQVEVLVELLPVSLEVLELEALLMAAPPRPPPPPID